MTDYFNTAARAEAEERYEFVSDMSCFEEGAEWAQRYLAAQEPTDAEVESAADVLEMIDGMDFQEVARAALSAARAVRAE